MPKPDSHIEFAWVMVNHSIIIVGGTTEKHPITKKMVLVGEVFQFNLDSLVLTFYPFALPLYPVVCDFCWEPWIIFAPWCMQKWSVIGKLPYRVKTTLAGFWNGWLYFTSGQRDKGPDDPAPKKVLGEMWRTKLSLWYIFGPFFQDDIICQSYHCSAFVQIKSLYLLVKKKKKKFCSQASHR